MDPSQPLAYESLKLVLQYMEPNLRFKLANCIPSIASTEKLVPLKINKLHFKPNEFIVNDTSYKIGTLRCYPTDVEPLRGHQLANSEGGAPYDLDRYGFPDYSEEEIVMDGDVVIGNGNFDRRDSFMDPHELEDGLEVHEWAMAIRLGQKVEPLNENNRYYPLAMLYALTSTDALKKEIDRLKADLAPFRNRRNHTSRPYSTMVQFTVSCGIKKSEISKKPGNTRLYEVQKDLANRLFGNRKDEPLVKHFEIGFCQQDAAPMVIRLPKNFQIKVREMHIIRNVSAVCDAAQSLIHSSSFPLERIRVCNGMVVTAAHTIVHSAQKLHFTSVSFLLGGITEFLQFRNQWIYLEGNQFTPDEHVTLLRKWIEEGRTIGTSFVSKIEKEARVTDILAKCKEHLNGYDAGERFVKVPMNGSSEINVSYIFLERRGFNSAAWMMTLKVVAA